MTDDELQEYYSTKRMTQMMTEQDNIFKGNAKAVALKAALNADVAELDATGAARVSARGRKTDGTADKNAAESALEDFLRKIAADAKIIKKVEPDFDNVFKLPRGTYGTQKLLDIGRGFISDLTAAAVAKFAEYGTASATPANIQTKIDAVEAGRSEQNTGRGAGIAATGATKAIVKRLKANRRTLKNIGENILEDHGDAGLIAEWSSACKIEKAAKKGGENPPPTT